jgi:multidrug efflux pump subunit AcrA (membrane-fusion protein)
MLKRILVTLSLSGLVLIGLGLLVAYNLPWETHTWRQRVIVEVDTPEGAVTGSSVQEVVYSRAHYSVPDGPDRSFTPKGEAVVVDLGEAGVLFALLRGAKSHGDAGRLAPIAFAGDVKEGYSSDQAIARLLNTQIGNRVALPEKAYPLLVTFADISDPKTVKQVDPDNLAATFGPGFSVRSISIEMTDESVTEGMIERVLELLNDYYDRRLDGNRYGTITASSRLANDLSAGYFDTVR